MERNLTAILFADVHGCSRLMGEDEEATPRNLSSHRIVIDGLIEQHRGSFVNSAGDSVPAEFASVVNPIDFRGQHIPSLNLISTTIAKDAWQKNRQFPGQPLRAEKKAQRQRIQSPEAEPSVAALM